VVAPRRSGAVAAYVAVLAVLAAALTLAVGADLTVSRREALLVLPVFALLIAAAEWWLVRFRVGRDVNALNLLEAVLAPLLFAFAAGPAVLTVAAGQLLAGVLRRNSPLKAAFNVAQWSLATACGAAVLAAFDAQRLEPQSVLALLLALVVVGLVNNAAFTLVLAISQGGRPRDVLRGLAPVVVPGWLGGLAANAALGLLFVLAYAGSSWAVLVFVVPLGLLHLAYRGQAAARADRGRLAGLHRAAGALTRPIDPRDGVAGYLREVAVTFDARVVLLVLRGEAGREVHRLERASDGELPTVAQTELEPDDSATLAGALAALPGPTTVRAGDGSPLARALRDAGGDDLLAAPLLDDGRLLGALLVLDRGGLEPDTSGELAVVEALAREATGAFAKGRLLGRVIEERRKLELVVSTTSDGMLALDADGLVLSWNPALERLTGLAAAEVVGRPGALSRLDLRTVRGEPVDLAGWREQGRPPAELRLRGPEGAARRVSCSYSTSYDVSGEPETLVVIARDVTPAEQIEQLRTQFARLVEAEAAQRLVVEHLQEAVMPPRPEVPGAEVGVAYVASDPSSPTGGDLYDCQVLPSGELHLAVVDVLGHGTHATQDALTVMHTLRTVVLDGTPLESVIARADELLGRQDRDLVATVVLARYSPRDGRVQIVSGGHPPALVVTSGRSVRELEPGGCAIGWPSAGSDSVVQERLAPGDALVLYTDGLVEARKDIIEGLEALAVHARDVAHLPAQRFAQALVDRALAGAERRDDSLALVLRRTPVPALPVQPRPAEARGR
jgi:PAS domain S-box-containing protein